MASIKLPRDIIEKIIHWAEQTLLPWFPVLCCSQQDNLAACRSLPVQPKGPAPQQKRPSPWFSVWFCSGCSDSRLSQWGLALFSFTVSSVATARSTHAPSIPSILSGGELIIMCSYLSLSLFLALGNFSAVCLEVERRELIMTNQNTYSSSGGAPLPHTESQRNLHNKLLAQFYSYQPFNVWVVNSPVRIRRSSLGLRLQL